MASICDDPNGRRRILFVAPNGSRKAVRLGKLDRKAAEIISRHVEHILSAKISGDVIPRTTAAWLAGIGDPLKAKLAAVGLIEGQATAPTLKAWCESYIAGRTDLAPRSVARLEFAARLLVKHFGHARRIDTVNTGDAEAYSRWLSTTRKANTVRRQVGWAKQFFGAAVKHELLVRNPFVGLAASTRPDRSRDHFVTRDEADRIINACPDAEWRLIVALCRFAGLRCPTEVLALRWEDVIWDQSRMNITNVKTSSITGETYRTIPLFPEVRRYLEDAYDLAPAGAVYAITRYRDSNANLRTQLARIARKAGVSLWEKPFMNMRASFATELAQNFSGHVASEWAGHSQAIAKAHYWQVTEADFEKAAHNPAQQTTATGSIKRKESDGLIHEINKSQCFANQCDIVPICPVHPEGFERTTDSPRKTRLCDRCGAESGALTPLNHSIDDSLAELVSAWATLPEAMKAGILAMVRAAGG